MTTTIYWLKNDLRLTDNPALTAAAESQRLLCVYCLDDRHFATSAYGPDKLGPHRAAFLRQSLEALSKRLSELGNRLLVIRDEPERALPALAERCGAEHIITTDEIAPEEQAALQRVAMALPDSRKLVRVEGGGLYQSHELPFDPDAPGKILGVFTRFRKKMEAEASASPPLPAPIRLPASPVETAQIKSEPPSAELWPDTACPFLGGERAGLARVEHYIWASAALAHYKQTRNQLLGEDYSSKFSPWLALGCLSPRTLMHEVAKFEAQVTRNNSTYWMAFELYWREFFRWVLRAHGTRLFQRAGLLARNDRPRARDANVFQAWAQGRTGMPFVDANMRELVHTGYMSNRGRQIAASFFARDLGQDWRVGAAWFECQLVDYDVASNWGNWANVAGVGTDRRDHGFNVLWQAQRYDADAKFVCHWLPELLALTPALRHTPFLAPRAQQQRIDYPMLQNPPAMWQPYYPERNT